MEVSFSRRLLYSFCLVLPLLGACAKPELGYFQVAGPPFAVVASIDAVSYMGTISRSALTGPGWIYLRGVEEGQVCKARLKGERDYSLTAHEVLACADGREILLSLRNTGPAEGIGTGMDAATEDVILTLAFHPDIATAKLNHAHLQEFVLQNMALAKQEGRPLAVADRENKAEALIPQATDNLALSSDQIRDTSFPVAYPSYPPRSFMPALPQPTQYVQEFL